ncbi:MAG: NAD(P)/FAD-dependent oxidoreductase [Chloroflexota bacterium]
MEISGLSEAVDQRRVTAGRRAVSYFLSTWPQGTGEIVWAGTRPLTPNGLPALARAPRLENLFVATGPGMLGVTFAPVTGRAMAELVCDGHAKVDLQTVYKNWIRILRTTWGE